MLSRYHWHLGTIWTNPLLLDNKEKIAFITDFHIPVVQCRDYPLKLAVIEVQNYIKTISNKYKTLALYSLFSLVIKAFPIDNQFDDPPIPYSDLVTTDKVDEQYKYSISELSGVVIIGDFSKLTNKSRSEMDRLFPNLKYLQ